MHEMDWQAFIVDLNAVLRGLSVRDGAGAELGDAGLAAQVDRLLRAQSLG